jgi:hypothetical protein
MKNNISKIIKTIILLGIGGEAYHVGEHVAWQFMMEDGAFNFVITEAHNTRSIIVNSLVIVFFLFVLLFLQKKEREIIIKN